ncbi:MAG: PH domain-containing protein [Akkermansiaceae bacterium]
MTEDSVWKGSPSQWLNLGPYTAGVIAIVGLIVGGIFFPPAFIGLVLPIGWMVWSYLTVRTRVFELTSERLRITRGIINQTIDEVELYRVKDTQMIRTWWMRLTGLASISMETSDRTMPSLVIPAIHGGLELREQLRKLVEIQRDKKRVREMDFDDAGDGTF